MKHLNPSLYKVSEFKNQPNQKPPSRSTFQFIAVLYLVVVPLKKLQETGLGASGPLDPPETQVITGSLQVAHVHSQVLQPQTCSFSYCGQLGRPVGKAGTMREGREGKHVNTACCSAEKSDKMKPSGKLAK